MEYFFLVGCGIGMLGFIGVVLHEVWYWWNH